MGLSDLLTVCSQYALFIYLFIFLFFTIDCLCIMNEIARDE